MEGRRPEETEKDILWETEKKERETGGGDKKSGRDRKRDIDKTRKGGRKRQKRKTENAEKK